MYLLASLLSFLIFWPADDLSLTGIVKDVTGAAVRDARIVLESTPGQRRWEATTGDPGTFGFERLPPGSYRLTVAKPGFFELGASVRLEANKTFEFTLAPLAVVTESIEVIARPEPINTDAISPVHNVNDEVIQNLPFSGRRNFLNALSLMPGVLRDSNNVMHVHGSSGNQVRYQMDGINLTDPATGGLSSNIPIDAIESVDMDLTGYSADSGKGSGGVVHVQSRFIGDQMQWGVTDFFPGVNFRQKTIAEFSPRLLASGPIIKGKVGFMYSGSLRYVRTFNEDLPEGENRRNETVSDQLLKVQWSARAAQLLTASLLYNSEYLGNRGLSILRPVETTTNSLRRGLTVAVSNRTVWGNTLVESMAQWTGRRESELAKGVAPFEIRPAAWSGNYYADRRGENERFHLAQTAAWERTQRGVTHRFKAGAEFDHVTSDLQLDKRDFRIYDADGEVLSVVRFAGPDAATIRNRELGFFFQDRMVFSPIFQLELGVRADRESIVGRNNFGPRAGFSFLPRENGKSKISGGVGFFYDNVELINLQLPRMQRRITEGSPAPVWIRVSPTLHNPFGMHWNVAWEHEWAPRWVSRMNLIQKRGYDQVRIAARTHASGFDLAVDNSGSSRYEAIELSLDRPIRTNLRILTSYIYSKTNGRPSISLDFPDPAVENILQAPEDWDSRHRFLSWGYFPFFLKSSASYSIEARSGFPFTTVDKRTLVAGPYNGGRFPMHFVTNFSLEKELPFVFGRRLAVRAGVLNLLNRFNPRYVDTNVNSPTFLGFSDSSARHFVGRLRLVKK
jgi:outer membrane receptor for ferrienterochelin and colicin